MSLARGASKAIRAINGTFFDVGTICEKLYRSSGTSADWAKDVLKADYVFSVELRDNGLYGFVLPPEEIIPSGNEAFAAAMYLFENAR